MHIYAVVSFNKTTKRWCLLIKNTENRSKTYTSRGPFDWQIILFAFPTQPRALGTGPIKNCDVQAIDALTGGFKLKENVPDGRQPYDGQLVTVPWDDTGVETKAAEIRRRVINSEAIITVMFAPVYCVMVCYICSVHINPSYWKILLSATKGQRTN
jgi:hypothetical protein